MTICVLGGKAYQVAEFRDDADIIPPTFPATKWEDFESSTLLVSEAAISLYKMHGMIHYADAKASYKIGDHKSAIAAFQKG